MAEALSQLDYAPRPAWHRNRRARRALMAGALLLGLLASLKWVGPAWAHARLLYYQHRCLAHAEAAGKLVYDGDLKGVLSADWDHFYNLFSPPGGRFVATVFLGELRQTDGSPRLVAINLPQTSGSEMGRTDFDIHVIKPATIWEGARLCTDAKWRPPLFRNIGPRLEKDAIVRIRAGQRDSERPDHFTIAIECASGDEIIDGWLRQDESVLLEPRGSPVSATN